MAKKKVVKKKEQETIDVFKDPANKNEEGEKEMENTVVVEKVVKEEELQNFKKELSDMLNVYIDGGQITQKKLDNLVDKITNTVKDEILINPIKTLLFCIKLITNLQKDLPVKNDILTIEQVNEVIEETHNKLLESLVEHITIDSKKDIEETIVSENKEELKEEKKEEKSLKGFAYFLAKQKK